MAISVPAATNVSTTLGIKKWRCLRQVPGAFHDTNRSLDAKEKEPAVCNCVNLASATSCACCEGERDSQLSEVA